MSGYFDSGDSSDGSDGSNQPQRYRERKLYACDGRWSQLIPMRIEEYLELTQAERNKISIADLKTERWFRLFRIDDPETFETIIDKGSGKRLACECYDCKKLGTAPCKVMHDSCINCVTREMQDEDVRFNQLTKLTKLTKHTELTKLTELAKLTSGMSTKRRRPRRGHA